MSKKFFSLIHGDSIHVAPKTKIIPGESFSSLIDAQKVLQEVEKDTKQYKMEAAIEVEQIKERAKKDGFDKGFSAWMEKISELEEEIYKVRKDIEKVVVPLALKAAKKIVGRELEISESTIVDIITNSLRAVAQHKRVTIYVNQKDFEIVEKQRDHIKKLFENLEALSIRPQKDIKTGGCIIETEAGIINAQIENQWLVLENAFQRLLQRKQKEPEMKEESGGEESVSEQPQEGETT
ncbi:MAG: HrpE/YscL family type III secretion apparatus protein [Waddliaceae bacterium]